MALHSYSCKGCTNTCYMIKPNGEVAKYCRATYDYTECKGKQWKGDNLICLDFTTDPKAEAREVRLWTKPLCEDKLYDDDGVELVDIGYDTNGSIITIRKGVTEWKK